MTRLPGTRNSAWTLFLDFDGVLNNEPFLRHQRNHVEACAQRLFDPANIEALGRLCRCLPVDAIVVTSTWRIDRSVHELRGLLNREGFGSSDLVTSSTPILENPDGRRGEIEAYLAAHDIARWLVIDDEQLAPLVEPMFFRTSAAHGLTEQRVDDVLEGLHGSPVA